MRVMKGEIANIGILSGSVGSTTPEEAQIKPSEEAE